jgi:hypothetical protein
MKDIKITIKRDGAWYVALFNFCGGGTQAKSIGKLLDYCKEVIGLCTCAHCHNPLDPGTYIGDRVICKKCMKKILPKPRLVWRG